MSANREQQRERLVELMRQARAEFDADGDYAHYLLDNGVTVEVPERGLSREAAYSLAADGGNVNVSPANPEPAPTCQPGDVAIATVQMGDAVHEGELVVRDTYGVWMAPGLGRDLPDHQVTVTSRAVVVTEVGIEELIEQDRWIAKGTDVVSVSAIRDWFDALGGTR